MLGIQDIVYIVIHWILEMSSILFAFVHPPLIFIQSTSTHANIFEMFTCFWVNYHFFNWFNASLYTYEFCKLITMYNEQDSSACSVHLCCYWPSHSMKGILGVIITRNRKANIQKLRKQMSAKDKNNQWLQRTKIINDCKRQK